MCVVPEDLLKVLYDTFIETISTERGGTYGALSEP